MSCHFPFTYQHVIWPNECSWNCSNQSKEPFLNHFKVNFFFISEFWCRICTQKTIDVEYNVLCMYFSKFCKWCYAKVDIIHSSLKSSSLKKSEVKSYYKYMVMYVLSFIYHYISSLLGILGFGLLSILREFAILFKIIVIERFIILSL